MRLGAYRHLVRLERPADGTRDAHGHVPEVWELACQAYAQVEPLSGRDLELARQTVARVTHRVRLRYRGGVDPRCRVVFRDRALNVRSVLRDDEGADGLTLLVEEAV